MAQESEASLEVIRRVMKGEGAPTALPGRLPAGLEVESLPVHGGGSLAGRALPKPSYACAAARRS